MVECIWLYGGYLTFVVSIGAIDFLHGHYRGCCRPLGMFYNTQRRSQCHVIQALQSRVKNKIFPEINGRGFWRFGADILDGWWNFLWLVVVGHAIWWEIELCFIINCAGIHRALRRLPNLRCFDRGHWFLHGHHRRCGRPLGMFHIPQRRSQCHCIRGPRHFSPG